MTVSHRESSGMRAIAASAVCLSGHTIQEKTTVSPGSNFTAIGNVGAPRLDTV
ncbi:hypothetical protein [Roseibium hamelinense]|uniref:hypothetical protein n=1 Tax=Roseibium hamelinense TaxID=150831 RepID=UPI00244E4F85|nr:hypothetical protein [Roseibium hamelinense]